MYYVYVLRAENQGRLYAGFTENLRRRLKEHARSKGFVTLLYYEAYLSEQAARARERKLKARGSAWQALKSRIGLSPSERVDCSS